jgi:hypothetical protein
MDYFEEESISGDNGMTINENDVSQDVNEIISAEPVETKQEVPAETIEISNKSIIDHLKPQENKYWHFSFKNEANKNQLTQALQNISGYTLTVEYGIPQNTPDITLKMNDNIVGKIHLLLCDRRDANLPEKYYCKIYFYHFKNQKLFEAVKMAVVNFFENFKGTGTKIGGKRNKPHQKVKTHKKKRINRRKRTSKRT